MQQLQINQKIDINPSNTIKKGWRMGSIKQIHNSKVKVMFGDIVDFKTKKREIKTEWVDITDKTKIAKFGTMTEYYWGKKEILRCNVFCDKLFNTENEKRLHENECQFIYGCNICKDRFKDKKYIQDHCRIHIGQDYKIWKCKICDEKFVEQYEFDAHQQKHQSFLK